MNWEYKSLCFPITNKMRQFSIQPKNNKVGAPIEDILSTTEIKQIIQCFIWINNITLFKAIPMFCDIDNIIAKYFPHSK